jgi:hypothetical protein
MAYSRTALIFHEDNVIEGSESGSVEDNECEKMVIVKTVTLKKRIQMVKREKLPFFQDQPIARSEVKPQT